MSLKESAMQLLVGVGVLAVGTAGTAVVQGTKRDAVQDVQIERALTIEEALKELHSDVGEISMVATTTLTELRSLQEHHDSLEERLDRIDRYGTQRQLRGDKDD